MTTSGGDPRRDGGPSRRRLLRATGAGLAALSLPFVGATAAADGDSAAPSSWTRTYGGGGEDSVDALTRTARGYAFVGTGDGPWIAGLAPDGELRWERRFPDRIWAASPAETPDGGVVTFLHGRTSVEFAAFDRDGELARRRPVSPPAGSDYPGLEDAVRTADDRYVAAGVGSGGWVAAFDADGTKAWSTEFDPATRFAAVHPASDGGVVVAGSASDGAGGERPYLAKVDAGGDPEWTTRFFDGCDVQGTVRALARADDGGYLLGGSVAMADDDVRPFLLAADADGTWRWTRRFSRYDGVTDVVRTGEGRYAAALTVSDPADESAPSPDDSLLVGVDATAAETPWERPLGTADSRVDALAPADDAHLAFGGQRRADDGDADGWVGTVELPRR